MPIGSAAMRVKGQADFLFFSSRNSLPAEKSGWQSLFLIFPDRYSRLRSRASCPAWFPPRRNFPSSLSLLTVLPQMDIGQYERRLSRDIPSAGRPWFWQWAGGGPFSCATLPRLRPQPALLILLAWDCHFSDFRGVARRRTMKTLTDNSPL